MLNILFGKSTAEEFETLDESTHFPVFEGVPQVTIINAELVECENYIDLLSVTTRETIQV